MDGKRDILDSYPAVLRDSIRQQRDELKARQLAGLQQTGPWAPGAELKTKRKRPTKRPVAMMRKAG